jgi:hypothetical protein
VEADETTYEEEADENQFQIENFSKFEVDELVNGDESRAK